MTRARAHARKAGVPIPVADQRDDFFCAAANTAHKFSKNAKRGRKQSSAVKFGPIRLPHRAFDSVEARQPQLRFVEGERKQQVGDTGDELMNVRALLQEGDIEPPGCPLM